MDFSPGRLGSSREIRAKERGKMGDVVMILGLALYIPMSMVYVLCRKSGE